MVLCNNIKLKCVDVIIVFIEVISHAFEIDHKLVTKKILSSRIEGTLMRIII